ncbi:MAG: hypothetical protein H0T46_21425 [Deltaproteobacteria bacterium]|nr:hypothetical protein [Deltaproteobacteria bacterium]
MNKLDPEVPSRSEARNEVAQREVDPELSPHEVANDNTQVHTTVSLYPTSRRSDAPQLDLRHVGDGRPFIRALARNIVRHELISASLIAAPAPRREQESNGSPTWKR